MRQFNAFINSPRTGAKPNMQLDSTAIQTGSATYCPEDNKLRLYVGRVPRPEYDALRAEGWTATPKQNCQFVAHWTPERRDTALAYGEDYIGDEDQSPADRAADRAERFGGYRDKRTDEATGHADRYDAGPQVHGFQSQARAERSAARHDRIADRAGDSWGKAEYWTTRTAGVISHALHVSAPDVRMGRIKELESDIRRAEKSHAEYAACFERWQACAAMTDAEAQSARALQLAYVEHGDYTHPRTGRKSYLYDHARREEGRNDDPLTGAEVCALWLSRHGAPASEGPWLTHYRLRLAYETQMMEAQGGRAGELEIVPGGWLIGGGRRKLSTGERQIVKVNKSPTTGRVVSVLVRDGFASFVNHWGNPFPDGVAQVLSHTIEIERAGPDCYRAPTPEELAAFEAGEKAAKKARKAAAPAPIPLINPTDADAERLQVLWNDAGKAAHIESNLRQYGREYLDRYKPTAIRRMTQAEYSEVLGGAYSRVQTDEIGHEGERQEKRYNSKQIDTFAKIRTSHVSGESWHSPRAVVILTDKPQKELPAAVWKKAPETAKPQEEGKVLHGKSRGLSYTVNG